MVTSVREGMRKIREATATMKMRVGKELELGMMGHSQVELMMMMMMMMKMMKTTTVII